MHRLQDDALQPPFKLDDMRTYIKFCRTITPHFTKESAEILKEEYKLIRQRERTDHKRAYPVTVRMLESLVRLSEAMARAHCDDQITPNYVREVCRLLRNSNINIQKNDIEFEELQEAINRERYEDRLQEEAQ